MRELKFRVWFDNVKRGEKKGNVIVWRTVSYYSYDPIIDNGGLLEVEGGWDISGHSNENYVLEQYTGLKDKNGKEIYEGDIVEEEFEYGGEKRKTVWQVRWCDDECSFELHYVRGFEVEDCSLAADDKENCEVIGNIHENPELFNLAEDY